MREGQMIIEYVEDEEEKKGKEEGGKRTMWNDRSLQILILFFASSEGKILLPSIYNNCKYICVCVFVIVQLFCVPSALVQRLQIA